MSEIPTGGKKQKINFMGISQTINGKEVSKEEFYNTYLCPSCKKEGIDEVDAKWNVYQCRSCKKLSTEWNS